MNRRTFLQSTGLLGGVLTLPTAFGMASVLESTLFKPSAADYQSIKFTPITLANSPQIINIFLYGGPSELAGNLSNISDIMANSQNEYPRQFDPTRDDTVVTPNNFWSSAGGVEMEAMLAAEEMTIYRTMNRVKDDNKGHGTSVEQNLVGNLDTDSPGMASTLAWVIEQNSPFDKPIDELMFPFVSFEGDSKVFKLGDLDLPLSLKPVSLNSNLQNPYQRTAVNGAGYLDSGGSADTALESMARNRNGITDYERLKTAFEKRAYMAESMGSLLEPDAVNAAIADYNSRLPVDGQIEYGNGNFGERLKAAVSLCLKNRETLFVSLGSGGLGGWDDHSQAIDDYPARMQELMRSIQAAMIHLKAAASDSVVPVASADGIIINVFGDFGRNVNLNDSQGWDHGNNQNFYTFGGHGLFGRQQGKIVGVTERIGESAINRQFTSPLAGSYQFEPFSVASTIFSYFGVNNPELLTGEAAINEDEASVPLVI